MISSGTKKRLKKTGATVTVRSLFGRSVLTDAGTFDVTELEDVPPPAGRMRHSTGATSQIRTAHVPQRRK
jgi:hypothetical protein